MIGSAVIATAKAKKGKEKNQPIKKKMKFGCQNYFEETCDMCGKVEEALAGIG